MALPAHILEKLPRHVVAPASGGTADFTRSDFELAAGGSPDGRAKALPLGFPEVDMVLPDGGLPTGAVVELAVHGTARATGLVLGAVTAAQAQGRQRGGEAPWCAFVDPSETLHAAGVVRAGVDLRRLLVLRPSLEALPRVVLRLVEARTFAVIVVDLLGVPGAGGNDVSLVGWPRIVRRLALALEGTDTSVLLVTDATARRSLALPAAQRLELSQPRLGRLRLRVAKDRRGRVGGPRQVSLEGVA